VKADLLTAASVNGIVTLARDGSSEALTAALRPPAELLEAKYEIRRRYAAVMVGTGTVMTNDPRLTSHRAPGFAPVRVTLDRSGRIPPHLRFLDGSVRTLVGVCRSTPRAYLDLLAARGAEAVEASTADGRGIDLARFLDGLAARGVGSVVVEGGGTIARALLAAGLLSRLHLLVIPAVLDAASVNLFEGGAGTLVRLRLEEATRLDEYVLLRYRVA
jgi:diaminohydroxyphosphoribosylaminopyrimidine deaminase/5-amino-6-(5-phosphoribosylamino)uracil reductase